MDIGAMLKALGEPTRLAIFRQLLIRKHCVRSLSKSLGITESAISQHMKVLRRCGLVYAEQFGYHTHYLPAQEAIDALVGTFTEMQHQSLALNRDKNVCECEYRKKNVEK